MPSSKGKPTDPKLREEAKKEVMNMEKGGGKGQWSAWKAAEMSKVYEKKGGGYEDSGDNPNEAKKGAPKPKKEAVEKGERKDPSEPVGAPKSKKSDTKKDDKPESKKADAKKDEKPASKNGKKEDKPESKDAGSKRKAETKETSDASKKTKSSTNGAKKDSKPAAEPTREQPKRGSKK